MHKANGFTLFEVLIALFIFTIVSIMIVSGLRIVLNSQTVTEKKSTQLADLQMTLLLLSRDIEQAINRPITNAKGGREPSLVGTSDTLTLTHTGFANPIGQLQRSTLQRSQYRFNGHTLLRETWEVLDQTAKSLPHARVLLDTLSEIQFEYLTSQGRYTNNWPDGASASALPKGIRVHLTIKHWGKLTQFYLLPTTTNTTSLK